MKRAILFDLDGVLIDSMNCHAITWQTAIKNLLNVDVPVEYFLINEGRNSKDILLDLMKNHSQNSESWKKISDYRDQLFLDSFQPKPIAGAIDLVKQLHSFGYRLGVATGSTRSVAEDILTKVGLRKYFQKLVTSEDVQFSKPHPQPYQMLLKQLGIDGKYALVIENAPLGIQSAIAANLCCFAVASTNPPEILSDADKVFISLDEMSFFLKDEFKEAQQANRWEFLSLEMGM